MLPAAFFIVDSNDAVVRQVFGAVQIAVSQAVPAVSVTDGGGTYNGQAFPATAMMTGVLSGIDTTPAARPRGRQPDDGLLRRSRGRRHADARRAHRRRHVYRGGVLQGRRRLPGRPAPR